MIRNPKNHPHAKDIDLDRLREMRLAGVKVADIAKALGCSETLTVRLAKRMGLPRRCIDPSRPINLVAMASIYESGESIRQIAEKVGASTEFVADRLREKGVKLRPSGGRPMDRIPECVRLWRSGMDVRQVAARMGLSWGAVRRRIEKGTGFRIRRTTARRQVVSA